MGSSDWVIWAAWADRITFEEIYERTGLTEAEVIQKMRSTLKRSSFKLWRKRVHQKVSIKHRARFKRQRQEEQNWSLNHHLFQVENEHVQDDGFRQALFQTQSLPSITSLPPQDHTQKIQTQRSPSVQEKTSSSPSSSPHNKDTL